MTIDATPEAAAFKQQTRAQWDDAAAGWDRHGSTIRARLRVPTDAMLEMAGLRSGQNGLVTYSCRSKCSFRPLGVRMPRGFFLPMLNADGAGYRSR